MARRNGKLAVLSLGCALKKLTEQEYLAMRAEAKVLEADHFGDKVLQLTDGSIFKMFRRKRLISSAALYPYAQRFANNAAALEKLGIPVPKVIAVVRIPAIARDAVHYQPLAGTTLREMARAGLTPDKKRELKDAFTRFVTGLHDKGIYFRSLHIGNVVYTPDGRLGLIDFSDLRIHPWPLGNYLRARNLRRMQGIADELDWLDYDGVLNSRRPEQA